MKAKKAIPLLLVLAMLITLVSACGSTGSSSSAPAQDASVEASAEAPETPAEQPDEPAEEPAPAEDAAESAEETVPEEELLDPAVGYELPLFDPAENVSFSMWVSFSDIGGDFMPEGYLSNKAYMESVEKTGVSIDMIQVSTETNGEKFNVMIASGSFPDIITNVSMLWNSSYDTAVEDGIFMDLTEMTTEYMPFYMQAYNALDERTKRDLHTDSGYMPKLISINSAEPAGATSGGFVRGDILEELGLEVPQTYDDLYEVLAAFKSSGMNEALMLPSGIVHASNALCSGYGVSGMFASFPMSMEPFFVKDGEVKYGLVEEGFKEYMQMMVDFYQAGYIDPDFITVNTNPMGSEYLAKCASDDVGVFFGETNLIPNYYDLASNPEYDIVPLAPITKNEGDATHFATSKSPISGRLATIAITTNAEGREEELGKYLDFFFTEEGALLAAMGVEGNEDGSYIVDENGELQYSDNWRSLDITENQKPTLYVYSVMPMLVPKTPSTYSMELQEQCADIWDANADDSYRIPDYLTMTAEEGEEYSSVYSDIETSVQENLSKFLVGDRPMAEWDSFVQNLWDMGMQKAIDLKQAAYDRYADRAV